MKKSGRRPRLTERVASAMSLPLSLDPGLFHLELNGPRELLLLHHCGLREYGDTLIEIAVPGGALRITGEGLELGAMDRQEVLLHGTVFSVELLFE